MTRTLGIANEPRFVQAFALAVDPGDALSLLLEIGAFSSNDLAIAVELGKSESAIKDARKKLKAKLVAYCQEHGIETPAYNRNGGERANPV